MLCCQPPYIKLADSNRQDAGPKRRKIPTTAVGRLWLEGCGWNLTTLWPGILPDADVRRYVSDNRLKGEAAPAL